MGIILLGSVTDGGEIAVNHFNQLYRFTGGCIAGNVTEVNVYIRLF